MRSILRSTHISRTAALAGVFYLAAIRLAFAQAPPAPVEDLPSPEPYTLERPEPRLDDGPIYYEVEDEELMLIAARSPRRIVISIPDRKLAFLRNGAVVRIYPIGVGKAATPSPSGRYRIISRVVNPYYHRDGKTIPPGPRNPVGTRWMGLSLRGYGIHGTNNPGSIGKQVSLGCIRMHNKHAEELFRMVQVGDPVQFYRTRTAEVARIFGTSGKEGKGKPADKADA
ncbi:MAG: L,D-transpeptidase [Bryobacteraceae bacterium]